MCGIWAIFGSDGDVCEQSRCASAIAHRGPDAFRIENIHHYRNCCFVFYHLAIVDEIYGMQPMRIRSLPNVWLVYNGEIYNYQKIQKEYGFEMLTKSDGESIIHLYDKFGMERAAAMLDGEFAFCLLDTKAEKIYIGRDTYGIKPLYRVFRKDGFLAVCSERKGLMGLRSDDGKETIDTCLPGYYEEYNITHDTGKVCLVSRRQHHYFPHLPIWRNIVDNVHPTDDIDTSIRLMLTGAVKKRLLSNRRMGCLLSGGLDSSLTAALTVQLAKEAGNKEYPIQTFCIGTPDSPDIIAARKVAKHIGTEHHEVTFLPEEGIAALDDVIKCLEIYDVITIRGSVGMYLLSKYIREDTDTVVLISGEGSDEVAQGYSYFQKAPTAQDADDESRRLLEDIHQFDVARTDRTTAAHGLELRVPFLDHYFTSYYLSIPPVLRQPKNGTEKYLIRKAFQGTGLIPDDILWRPKEGFSDGLASAKKPWFQYLQEHIEAQISDSMLNDASNQFPYNTPRTKESYYYRQIFERHYPGQASWTPYMWMPKWIDNATDPSQLSLYRSEDDVQNK